MKLSKLPNRRVPGLTLMEILIVLAIIGILIMMILPNFMGTVSEARSLEAQQQLKHLYMLQKNYHFKNAKYAGELEDIRFIQEKLATDNGSANYRIEIESFSPTTYVAKATAVLDFDGDGVYNEWTINQEMELKEMTPD